MTKRKSVTETAAANDCKDNLGGPDEQALLIHHFDKLRQQGARVEVKKAEFDAEKSILTDLFRIAKADGFSRKEMQALLDDSKASTRDLAMEEDRRHRLRAFLGLPSGTQLHLFGSPAEVQDEQHAEGQGYAAGLRGDACEAPDRMHARHIPAFTRGWGAGQEKLAWGLAAAGKIVDRAPDANARPVALEPEPEGEMADAAA